MKALFIAVSALLLLSFSYASHAASRLPGQWAGNGFMRISDPSHREEYCDQSDIVISGDRSRLTIEQWDNCIIDWKVMPLSFVAGQVLYNGRRIGGYDDDSFDFEYRNDRDHLVYTAAGRIQDGLLVIDEEIDYKGTWWSRARFEHRRKP